MLIYIVSIIYKIVNILKKHLRQSIGIKTTHLISIIIKKKINFKL